MADTAKRTRQGGFVALLPLALMALGTGVIVAHVVHPNFVKIAALLGRPWTPGIVQSAWKWAKKRGLPFDWVLATIIVESGANPRSAGDAGGESKGLMQVNTVANAAKLRAAGYRPEDLHHVDTGIEMGTLMMREFYDKVREHGAARVRTPIDETLRLAYKGPGPVYAALDRGQEPSSLSFAHPAIENWRSAKNRVAHATGTSARLFV